jgi:signal transduction histidine kinase
LKNISLLSSRLQRWPGRRGSLRTQLIAWNILALALLLGMLGVVIRYTVRSFLTASVNRELDRQVAHMPPPPPDGRFLPVGPPAGRPFFAPADAPRFVGAGTLWDRRGPRLLRDDNPYHPRHFDLQGRALMPFDDHALWDAEAFALAKQGERQHSQVVVDGVPLQVLSDPVFDGGKVVAVVQAAYPLTDVNRAIAGLDSALLTLIPVGLLCAGLGGAYLTDRVLRRVRRTTQAAGRISAQDFSARLPVTGNDEFSELAETFNGLLSRLESAFRQQKRLLEQQRRFTADASHELKTPLTVIKGTASMALNDPAADTLTRRALQEIDRAADTMSHLVQDLLLLARSDGGQLGKNRIELLAREVLERAISGVAQSGAAITLRVEDETLSVTGNEAELIRLFSNLLANAARCTPPEGAIRVTAQAEGRSVVMRVADTGPGIAPEHLPHLGERFYRVDAARSRPDGGTGLGLSICRGIVEAHRGAMSIESAVGKGTTVTISLPRG